MDDRRTAAPDRCAFCHRPLEPDETVECLDCTVALICKDLEHLAQAARECGSLLTALGLEMKRVHPPRSPDPQAAGYVPEWAEPEG